MEILFKDIKRVSDKEVLYQVSRNERISEHFSNKLIKGEYTTFGDFLESLPTNRRKFAEAVIEAYKLIEQSQAKAVAVKCSEDAHNLLKDELNDLHHEEFWVIMLNHACKVIDVCKLFCGGMASAQVDIRLIIRELIISKATSFIAVHNHPSGSLMPSGEDKALTKELSRAAKMMNIKLIDHLIIGGGKFLSFCDEGLL